MIWFLYASLLLLHSVGAFVVQNQQSPRRRSATCKIQSSPAPSSSDNEPSIAPLPFLPASDPNYRNTAPVGQGAFLVSRTGSPTAEELTNDNILKIVRDNGDCTDLEVNTLVWKCLGYRFSNDAWTNDLVFPKWREKFPTPPDFIGMQRIYSQLVDEPCLRANQQLVRSIPLEHKQQLRLHLRPMGFMGFKIAELTPNLTRRAQCANWLLYYREHLFGRSLEELVQARRDAEKMATTADAVVEDWRPPITEVF
jgi:hypothetical protein